MRFVPWLFAAVGLLPSLLTNVSLASVVATGFFSGTIESFNEQTQAQSTLATIASASDPFPGLSGIAYRVQTQRLYVSARLSDRVYTVNAITGAVLSFHQLATGSAPAGLALDSAGNIYVSNNGGNTVSVFNNAFASINTVTLPNIGVGNNLPNGLAFDAQNRLVISTSAGGGVFRYDPVGNLVTSLAPFPLANGQVALDGAGNILVGGAAFSNDVLKFDSAGNPVSNPFLTIHQGILPLPGQPFQSPDFTSPTGVTIDSSGNIIVAALGRTNPTSSLDNFQSNGGLFKFSPTGVLLSTFATGITPLSSVTTIAVPEPSCWGLGLVAFGWLSARRQR